jgi:hypothetical protein
MDLLLALVVAWGVPWLMVGILQLRTEPADPGETTLETVREEPQLL